MYAAKSETVKERFATRRTLESIDWTQSGIHGTGSLTPRARRLLQLYVSIARMDHCGLIAPMGAVADTLRRALDGGGSSIRTVQRANKELAEQNFVFIYQSRTKFCRIRFNPDAFSFWTRTKTKNVSPLPTMCSHVVSRETMSSVNLHATNCRAEDRTSITLRVNTPKHPDLNQEQRAGARAIDTRSKNRKNPVVFSLMCVLRKANDLHISDRRLARLKAQCEVDALGAGLALVHPSGVDWQYWARNWEEMPIDVRENTIRREILPALLGRVDGTETRPPVGELSSPNTGEPCSPVPTEQITAALQELTKLFATPEEPPKASTPSRTTPVINLSADDFAILDAARRRAKGET